MFSGINSRKWSKLRAFEAVPGYADRCGENNLQGDKQVIDIYCDLIQDLFRFIVYACSAKNDRR